METIDLEKLLFESKYEFPLSKKEMETVKNKIPFTFGEIIRFGRLVAERTLSLASGNLGFSEVNSEEINNDYVYRPFITADDDTLWTIDKKAFLKTLEQIK